jgi:hypothetical protein
VRRIRNPLTNVPKAQLLEDVEAFATEGGLTGILPLLQKGALEAQSPQNIGNIPELDGEEHRILHEEVTHR